MGTKKNKVLSLTEKVSIIRDWELNFNKASWIEELSRVDADGTIRGILLEKEKIMKQYHTMKTKITAALNLSHSNYGKPDYMEAKISILEKVLIEWYLRAGSRKKMSHLQLIKHIVDEKVQIAAYILDMNFSVSHDWVREFTMDCLRAYATRSSRRLNILSCSLKEIVRYVLARNIFSNDQARAVCDLRIENFKEEKPVQNTANDGRPTLYSYYEEEEMPNNQNDIHCLGKNEKKPTEASLKFVLKSTIPDEYSDAAGEYSEEEEIAREIPQIGNQSEVHTLEKNRKMSSETSFKVDVKSETPDAESDAPGISSANDTMQPKVRPILNYEEEEIASKISRIANQKDVHSPGNNVKKFSETSIKVEVKSETPNAESDAPGVSSAIDDMQHKVWPLKHECKSEDEISTIYFITEVDEGQTEGETAGATFLNNQLLVKNECDTSEGNDGLKHTFGQFDVIVVDSDDEFDASTSPNDIITVSLIKSELPIAADNEEEVTTKFVPNLELNAIKIELDECEIQISD